MSKLLELALGLNIVKDIVETFIKEKFNLEKSKDLGGLQVKY